MEETHPTLPDAAPFLELVSISKTYPGVVALRDVSLSVAPAEVIGLIGENGAGKSTLMRVLGGVVAPTKGMIRIDGVERASLTVNEATAAGIAFVHQELNLFDNLDVAANVFIGREPLWGGPLKLVDRKALHGRVQPLLDRLNVDFAPDTPVSELSIAQQQLLEIAKALSFDARLVIMDEPTSSLTLTETSRLLEVVAALKASGVSVIFISHRLNEIEQCADRVVVLRDGCTVGALDREHIHHDAMIRLMIGRDLKSLYTPPAAPPGSSMLDIEAMRTSTYPDQPVSLSVRQRRNPRPCRPHRLGADGTRPRRLRHRPSTTPAPFASRASRSSSVRRATPSIAASTLIPEDRKRSGLLLDVSITENISLPDLASYAHGSLVQESAEIANAEQQRRRLRIKVPDVGELRRARCRAATSKRSCWRSGFRCGRASLFSTSRRGASTSARRARSTKSCANSPTPGSPS